MNTSLTFLFARATSLLFLARTLTVVVPFCATIGASALINSSFWTTWEVSLKVIDPETVFSALFSSISLKLKDCDVDTNF